MCLCILKCIFVFFNVTLTIVGLAIVAAGVAVLVLLKEIEIEEFKSLGTAIIIIGCIFTAIFFCGCCGAVTNNRCLLITYSLIITIFTILTIVCTVLYSNLMSDIKDFVIEEMAADLKDTLPILEPFLQCCGSSGPDSYEGAIPMTCCPDFGLTDFDASQIPGNINDLDIFTCSKQQAYERGCLEVLGEFVDYVLGGILKFLIAVDVVEVTVLIIAIMLTCDAKKRIKWGQA